MALPIRSALRSAGRYVFRNPRSLVTTLRHAAGFRVAVPLEALRWVVENTPPKKRSPTDVAIEARPPAVFVGATVDVMGTKLRAEGSIRVEELRVDSDEMRLSLRLSDVDMRVLGNSESPIAGLLKSGALDLARPGNLVSFLPKKPPALVDAKDDRLVIDLLRVPKIAANERLQRILQTLTPVVSVSALRTEGDFLILALRATPGGFPRALAAARV